MRLDHRFRVVDVGVRLDPDPPGERGRAVEPDRLERELHEAGVVRAVVTPGPREAGYLAANNAVARVSVERPLVAFARLAGPRDPGSRLRSLAARRREWHTSPEDVEQYAYDGRFEGFALDPMTDGLPDEETLAALADVDRPVLVAGGLGFPPRRVAETLLAWEFPVVLGSFGGYPLARDLMDEAVDLLDAHDHLFLDTRAVRYRRVLERALKEHPDRVLFASGAPDVHPSVAVTELLTLSVPDDALGRAFDRNPSRVIEALAP